MKSLLLTICLLSVAGANISQAQAFETLKEKFAGEDEVFSVGTSGFFARAVLSLCGEHEFKSTIRNIQRIRLITVPKSSFAKHEVSVNGFRNILASDSYESLARIRDKGDDVSIFIKSGKRSDLNRYFVLIENSHDVMAMEIKGFIDPEHLVCLSHTSFNN